MESTDQLAKKAMGLRPTERIRLVEAILYSLDKPDPDIEKSWIAEAEARYEAYKRGELEAIEWDESERGMSVEGSVYIPRMFRDLRKHEI